MTPGSTRLEVLERGEQLQFSYEDMLRHHGGGSPGGVAHAFKVMERAFGLLGDGGGLERREINVVTAFGGPGARDAFELVTSAVTDGRYVVDEGLTRPERGTALERFVFVVSYRGRSVTLLAREGFVPDELTALVRREHRSPEEERRLDALKLGMADLVMASAATDVYEVVTP